MQKQYEAYAQTANMVTSDPRQFDATLLTKSAGQLQRLRDTGSDLQRRDLSAALLYNRKIWTVYAASAADNAHPLPREIKQNIANLAVFIFKRTIEIESATEFAPEQLDALININRQIAMGLSQKSEAA
jgi:flagellar protein FlaF